MGLVGVEQEKQSLCLKSFVPIIPDELANRNLFEAET